MELMLPFAFVVVTVVSPQKAVFLHDMHCPCFRCYFPLFAAFLLFCLCLFPFSSSLSLSPVSFPLFLTFLREDCLTYRTCSELHCDPSPLTLPHFPFLPSSMSSFFPDPFSFICLLFLVPFFKLFSTK